MDCVVGRADTLSSTATRCMWQSIPVRQIPLSRFVIPLHDISVPHLRTDHTGDAVWAFSRWPDDGDVWISDGRHRVLRALLRGDEHIDTRLLVIP